MSRRLIPALLAALAIVALSPAAAFAQGAGGETLDRMYGKAKQAISQDAYETAVKILTEAKARFPSAHKIDIALGDLYYSKELFPLALEEYRSAEKKGSQDISTLTQISRCYGKLNREKDSIAYLLRILGQYPDSSDTIDDLGWMYFKTHQLEKGEETLLGGIARLGINRGIAMTLGTVYSGMNVYEKSRAYYTRAIDDAVAAGDRNFAAIAYYNLSLLERKFYHYNSALRYTDESIAMEDRPSGHLARGELFQSRMDFGSALTEFQTAYTRDTTPLSKVNLAALYQKLGRLELARRYAEEVLASRDLAWMMYYGTDITRHYQDIHELLADIYRGLARVEAGKPTDGPIARCGALFASLRDLVLARYHEQRFRLLSLKVGGELLDKGSTENAYWEFYKGNQGYPEVALKYLGLARDLEVARTPHAGSFYLLEEGAVRGSSRLLEKSLKGFDQFWEREAMEESLRRLAPLLRGDGEKGRRREAIERLFEINPGALLQTGLGLPLDVHFDGMEWSRREKGLIVRYLGRAGSERSAGARYALRLSRMADGSMRWSAIDSRSAALIASGNTKTAGSAKRRCVTLVASILEELYAVE